MNKFKLVVTKDQKRHTVILTAENDKLARERVHKEGYSILSVEEITDEGVLGHKFVFSGMKDGEVKTGRVVGNDIFKVFVKLKGDLGYDINLLYAENDEGLPYEEKKKIVKDLEGEFEIFKGKTKQIKEKKSSDERQKFYLQKELDDTYKLIDYILIKLDNLMNGNELESLSIENKGKLKDVYNSIIKIKESTNITKLKEIGELALLKIGTLEINDLEVNKNINSKKLLKETNKLLKNIGSSKQFIEKNKDLKYIIINFFNEFKSSIKNINTKTIQKEKVIVDKSSHSYIKTELLLKKYKEKLNANTKIILQNLPSIIFSYLKQNDKIDEIFIRRSVIKQNISLFTLKQKGTSFSYTSVVKGYNKILQTLNNGAQALNSYIYLIIVLYTIFFIGFLNINYYNKIYLFNYSGVYYFLIFLSIHLILKNKLGIINLILSIVFLSFIIIFGVVNF